MKIKKVDKYILYYVIVIKNHGKLFIKNSINDI